MHEIVKIDGVPLSRFLEGYIGSGVLGPREAAMLDYCQKLGEVHAGFIDMWLVCCWGLIPGSFVSEQAYLWLWFRGGTSAKFTFIRRSQIQVREMLKRYPVIIGHCQRHNRSALRWLRWLGAEFEPGDVDILPFTIRRPD